MSERATETTVTCCNAFTLSVLEGLQPAGTYRLKPKEATCAIKA